MRPYNRRTLQETFNEPEKFRTGRSRFNWAQALRPYKYRILTAFENLLQAVSLTVSGMVSGCSAR